MPTDFEAALDQIRDHYARQFGGAELVDIEGAGDEQRHYSLHHASIRPGNGPEIIHHGASTDDVMLFFHGLTSSPYYLQAIGRAFAREGANVVIPLLPAHGLADPGDALLRPGLAARWIEEIDRAVEFARPLGRRLSLGGFSAGGTLVLHKALREPSSVNGGLFLFSPMLDVGRVQQQVGGVPGLHRLLVRLDGDTASLPRNPYRYPRLPRPAGLEMVKLLRQTRLLARGRKMAQPVFAAHSVDDTVTLVGGTIRFLQDHVEDGWASVIAAGVAHAALPLAEDIPLEGPGGEEEGSRANPAFDWMMADALRVFDAKVRSRPLPVQ